MYKSRVQQGFVPQTEEEIRIADCSRNFTTIAMIYVDCQILAIVVKHGNRRKITTIAMIYVDC